MRETAEQLKCFCSSSNRKMFWKISAELRVKEEFVLQYFHVWPLDQNRWASFWNLQTKQQQRNELKLFIISSFNRFQGGSVTGQDFSGIDGFLVYFWRERQTETSVSALAHCSTKPEYITELKLVSADLHSVHLNIYITEWIHILHWWSINKLDVTLSPSGSREKGAGLRGANNLKTIPQKKK